MNPSTETALLVPWHKSTHSNNVDDCAECAVTMNRTTLVRDTKARERGHVSVASAAWVQLLDTLKR